VYAWISSPDRGQALLEAVAGLAAGHPHGLPHTAVAHDLVDAIEGVQLFGERITGSHRVHARLPIYSARIDLDWRAMGVLKDGTLIWLWVGSHKTYEALLLKGRLG
jgi:hypothetical protein